MALNVPLKAAIEQRSIDAVCADLASVMDGNTLREALNRTLTIAQLRQPGYQLCLLALPAIALHSPRLPPVHVR